MGFKEVEPVFFKGITKIYFPVCHFWTPTPRSELRLACPLVLTVSLHASDATIRWLMELRSKRPGYGVDPNGSIL